MSDSIRFVGENGESCAVRPWFGSASRNARKAQDDARKAARAAREAKATQTTDDANGVSWLLSALTTD